MHTPLSEALLALCLVVFIAGAPGAFAATASLQVGQIATLKVTSNGTAPLKYQWYKNGVAVSGATSASYALTVRSLTDAGLYTAKVSNTAGSTLSDVGTISVVGSPVIVTQPLSQSVSTGTSVSFAVTALGSPAPTYQWRKDGVAITGATAASYSIASTSSTSGGVYSVVVKNTSGSVTSAGATLTVVARATSTVSSSLPPTKFEITTQPAAVTADAGTTATFSVGATSPTTMTYQWLKNGTAIAGATAATYKVTGAALIDEGTYSVKITSGTSSLTSTGALLNVNQPFVPPALGADFNRDGYADVLWQNTSTGVVSVRLMKGLTVLSSVTIGKATAGWDIEGTGDFDGDGGTDILWRNRKTGENLFWLMNGTTVQGTVKIASQATNWWVAGIADFNDDGFFDIAWRNASTTDNSVWLMHGSVVSKTAALPAATTDWRIVTAADFNGDSYPDLVWYNKTTFAAKAQFMKGLTAGTSISLGAAASSAAHIAGFGDFNDNGKADLLWQTDSGLVVVWYCDGTKTSSKANMTTVAPEVTLRN